MMAKETKLSKDDYIPASIRIPNLDFDSGLKYVNRRGEVLSPYNQRYKRVYS